MNTVNHLKKKKMYTLKIYEKEKRKKDHLTFFVKILFMCNKSIIYIYIYIYILRIQTTSLTPKEKIFKAHESQK